MDHGQPKKRQKVNIELPADLEPKYSNIALITHSPAEIILDFAQVLPRSPKGKVQSRIIMTPMHARLLHKALGTNLDQFEATHGPIKTHQGPTLADQLFKQPPPPSGDE
ncbi:MAG: DUF3467 domain-containing protein [Chloroflexota bacterium]